MTRRFKISFTILILNIVALSAAIIFVTSKKLAPKPVETTVIKPQVKRTNRDESNYRISQWKLIGQLNNADLAYDFKNGLGGQLNLGSEGLLLDGESVWIYSTKLREILTEASKASTLQPESEQNTLGFIAIINRVNSAKLNSTKLWQAFPMSIGEYRFNLVKPNQIDLLNNEQANQLFYDSRKQIEAFFKSLEVDKTSVEN